MDVIPCYACWPHSEVDCACDVCDGTGTLPANSRNVALFDLVREGTPVDEAQAAHPLLCERCQQPADDLDPDSGLCPTCVANNSRRVVL